MALDESAEGGRLARPVSFIVRMQLDQESGGWPEAAAVWFPVPPPGYVSLGCVVEKGLAAPSIAATPVRCLRLDLACSKGFRSKAVWRFAPIKAQQLTMAIWAVLNEVLYCTLLCRAVRCGPQLQGRGPERCRFKSVHDGMWLGLLMSF